MNTIVILDVSIDFHFKYPNEVYCEIGSHIVWRPRISVYSLPHTVYFNKNYEVVCSDGIVRYERDKVIYESYPRQVYVMFNNIYNYSRVYWYEHGNECFDGYGNFDIRKLPPPSSPARVDVSANVIQLSKYFHIKAEFSGEFFHFTYKNNKFWYLNGYAWRKMRALPRIDGCSSRGIDIKIAEIVGVKCWWPQIFKDFINENSKSVLRNRSMLNKVYKLWWKKVVGKHLKRPSFTHFLSRGKEMGIIDLKL